MTEPAQWFDEYGHCACGKPAVGILRGVRNENLGPHCKRCAERRIRAGRAEREEKARDKRDKEARRGS